MSENYLSRETLTKNDRTELEQAIAAPTKTDVQEAIIRARSAYLTQAERSDLDAIINPKPTYESMTVKALKELAEARKIDLGEAKTKAEIIAVIEAVLDRGEKFF